ncbi:MAG: V-type ATP synthase subunit D [Clostridiaceae bacterium]|nr:V-type ATP synthase subunit D [Clostridiaceae bacterium]
MSLLPVSPTRMELSRLKKQLQLSERGHKLLKDKQDELMRQFIDIVKETKALRADVEARFRDIRYRAILAKAAFPEKDVLENSLKSEQQPNLTLKTKNQMGVHVPVMSFDNASRQDGEFLSLSPALSETKRQMSDLFEDLLKLSQLEKNCVILSAEIEKTRRRVNALEYMTIPQLKETIRFIRMRLEDAERDRITRLIKMQDFEISADY